MHRENHTFQRSSHHLLYDHCSLSHLVDAPNRILSSVAQAWARTSIIIDIFGQSFSFKIAYGGNFWSANSVSSEINGMTVSSYLEEALSIPVMVSVFLTRYRG